MSEKPIITKEQAEIIEKMKRTGIPVTWESNGWYVKRDRRLNNFHFKKFIHAICNGYEVEPEFKVGDWVVLEDGYIGEIEFINEVEEWANIGDSKDTKERGVCLAKTYDLVDIVRHATPSEIAEEKERRFWKKLGREVDEYREGDVVEVGGDFLETVVSVFDGDVEVSNGWEWNIDRIRLVCPVENRLDREGEV